MNKLGDREILFVGTFLAPESETLLLLIPLGDESLPVSIDFMGTELDDKSPVSWKTVDGRFCVMFHGLKEGIVTRILQTPVKVGTVDKRPLSMMLSIYKHHKAAQVTVQFMAGGMCL